jgi:hypothetical protein
MKTETIYLENQVILVSDEIAGFTYNKPTWNSDRKIGMSENNRSRIIIAANPKLGDLPLLPMPDDEASLLYANNYKNKGLKAFDDGADTGGATKRDLEAAAIGIAIGYKAAKKNSSTKEDMIGFVEWLRKNLYLPTVYKWYLHSDTTKFYSEEELLKIYLDQKQKPQFIPEIEVCESCGGDGIYIDGDNNRLKCKEYANHSEPQLKIFDGKIAGRWNTNTNP